MLKLPSPGQLRRVVKLLRDQSHAMLVGIVIGMVVALLLVRRG